MKIFRYSLLMLIMVLLFITTGVRATPPTSGATSARDQADATAYAAWANGDNDGYGFGAWTLTSGTNAGHFMGASTGNGAATDTNGDGDIDTSGESWGMWANSGDTADAVRPFNSALTVGDQFQIQIDNGYIDNGNTVGFALRNSANANLFELYFVGGGTSYTINDASGQIATGIGITDEGLHIQFTLTGTDTYRVIVTPLVTGVSYTFWGALIDPGNGQDVSQVRLFNANAGNNADHNAYFNSIRTGYVTTEFDNSTAVSGNTVQMRTILTVDLDHDGDQDLVTGRSSSTNELRAWQNNSSPFGSAWSETQVGDTGTATNAIATADLDHDGYIDLVAGGTDNNVYIFKGNSTPFGGAWATSRDISATSAGDVNGLTVADINRDSNLDIISVHTSGSGNEVTVWQNPYDGSTNPNIFDEDWTAHNLSNSTNKTANDVTAADIDRDGYTDLIVGYNGTTGAEVLVWENTHDTTPWTFTQHNVDSGSGTVNSVATADFDKDGYVDIAQGSNDDEVVVWENSYDAAAWTFSEHIIANLNADVERVAINDFDNNGYFDVAVGMSTGADNELLVLGNNADNTFDWSFSQRDVGATSTNITGLAAADLDNDGDADLATARDNTTTGGEYEIAAWQNDLPHRNAPWSTIGNNFGTGTDDTWQNVLADLDGDGDLDLTATNQNQQDVVYLNDGDGTFDTTSYNFGTGSDGSQGLAVGDVDNDDDLDLVVVSFGQQDVVYLNDGDGTFDTISHNFGPASGTVAYTARVTLGDLDNDGDLDIAVIGDAGDRVHLNDGDGTFDTTSYTLTAAGGTGRALVMGDLDGDGDVDIAVGNASVSGSQNIILLNDGTGHPFDTLSNNFGTGSDRTRALALGDVDNDGDLDLAVGNISGGSGPQNVVYLNDGDGTFDTTSYNFGTGSDEMQWLAMGDVDGDGDLDLAASNNGQQNVVYLNDGDGTFDTTSYNFGTGADQTRMLVLGDVDGDGDLDLAVTTFSQQNVVYINQGGNAGFALTDTSVSSPVFIPDSTEDDVMQVDFTHNGVAGDRALELNYWNLAFFRGDCATPLTDAEADTFLDEIRIRLDDGDGNFETDGSDVQVGGITGFNMTGGVQLISFAEDNTNVQVTGGNSKTYWISALATATASTTQPNNFCLEFNPDTDALVEGKTPDFSVSIQDSTATNTGNVPTAVTLQNISATSSSAGLAAAISVLLLLWGGLWLRKWNCQSA
ncbi:MAG: hypothetical protein GY796_13175 [Chloroflexi bacterium]|nr:hypothetical protein [Chloroflexota bacterium]